MKKHHLIKTLILSSSRYSSSEFKSSKDSDIRNQSSSVSNKDTSKIPKTRKKTHNTPFITINKDTTTRNRNHASHSSSSSSSSTSSSTSTARPPSTKSHSLTSSVIPPAVQFTLPDPTILFTNNHLLIVNKPAGYHSQPNEALLSSLSQTKTDNNDNHHHHHHHHNATTTTSQMAIPSPSTYTTKCLLTKLKLGQFGGGSQHDFLLPIHRLDQPCTGIILLAKTTKGGSRIGKAFRDKVIEKEYLCVVTGNLETMIQHSLKIEEVDHPNNSIRQGTTPSMQFYIEDNEKKEEVETMMNPMIVERNPIRKKRKSSSSSKNTFYRLSGIMEPKHIPKNPKEGMSSSVSFKPLSKQRQCQVQSLQHTIQSSSDLSTSNGGGTRICHLEWTYLSTISGGIMLNHKNNDNNNINKNHRLSPNKSNDSSSLMHLLLIKTSTGAKHQIRAMMAQLAKSPICGDLRYGAKESLPDQSVALHARSLYIPPNQVSLGETDFTHPIIAPIPSVWKDYFSMTEKNIKQILS